jgi:hypothetical protein
LVDNRAMVIRHTLIAVALVASAVVADYFLLTMAAAWDADSLWAFCSVIVFSQITFSLVWLVYGTAPLPLRIAPPLALIETSHRLMFMTDSSSTGVIIWFSVIVLLALETHYLLSVFVDHRTVEKVSATRRSQFTIRDWFWLTSGIAMALAFFVAHRTPMTNMSLSSHHLIPLVSIAAMAALGVWTAFGRRPRLMARLLLPPLLGVALAFLWSDDGSRPQIAVWLILQWAFVAAPLALIGFFNQRTQRAPVDENRAFDNELTSETPGIA